MTTTSGIENGFQDEILATIRKSQDVVIEALQQWTDVVQSVMPAFPALDLPYMDKLPKPETLVSGAYDFAGQLLATQRKFAEDVLEVTAPLSGRASAA
jgi:hypothetical protein